MRVFGGESGTCEQLQRTTFGTLWNRHHETHGGKREDYFGPVYLAKEFSGSVEDFLAQCAFGSNDYGSTRTTSTRAGGTPIYQFKWSEDHNLFAGSLKRLVESGMERCSGTHRPPGTRTTSWGASGPRSTRSRRASTGSSSSSSSRGTRSARTRAAASRRCGGAGVEEALHQRLLRRGPPVDLTFEFRSNETRGKSATHVKKTHQYDLRLEAAAREQLDP